MFSQLKHLQFWHSYRQPRDRVLKFLQLGSIISLDSAVESGPVLCVFSAVEPDAELGHVRPLLALDCL